jgi:hypothetical protein
MKEYIWVSVFGTYTLSNVKDMIFKTSIDTHPSLVRGRRDRDRMVVGFTTTYAIRAYHH